MARFTGIPPFTGTVGPVCIYQMYGRYFMRTRSSLDGKRVKKDPAFRKTMQYAALLAKASRIGSTVYNSLPGDRRQHTLYRKLTGEAMTWLKYQWKEKDIIEYLQQQYGQGPVPVVYKSTCLNPSYRHKTPRLNNNRSKLEALAEKPVSRKRLFIANFYRAEFQLHRRKINEEIVSFPWAENVKRERANGKRTPSTDGTSCETADVKGEKGRRRRRRMESPGLLLQSGCT